MDAAAAEKEKAEEVSPLAEFFLKALPNGVLRSSGLHTIARCGQVCRAARVHCSEGALWESRLELLSARWNLTQPLPPTVGGVADAVASIWPGRYLSVLRPRCDGIYIGHCKFKRWVRLGHHQDLRKNAEQLAMKAGAGGGGEWLEYRRYVRLLPPDSVDGSLWALVLQDPCPREAAEKVLIAGVDSRTHANPAKSEGVLGEGAVASASDPDRLRKRISVGRYTFKPEESKVEVRYAAADGNFHLTFCLSHGGPRVCADRLTWEAYTMEDESSEVIAFNLGRLPDWKGGGLADDNKDHFPQMQFRPKVVAEHLC